MNKNFNFLKKAENAAVEGEIKAAQGHAWYQNDRQDTADNFWYTSFSIQSRFEKLIFLNLKFNQVFWEKWGQTCWAEPDNESQSRFSC